MSIVSGKLLQQKISAGSVDTFGQSLRTFVPEFQICPPRAAFDQYGRDSPPQSIDTQTCPGGYPSLARIEVENSLRPFISPLYFNLPIGISGGADTLFGRVNINRPNAFGNIVDLKVPMTQKQKEDFQFLGSNNVDSIAPLVSGIASTYYGNVMASPDYNTYGLTDGFEGRYGYEEPKKVKQNFRYTY
jgi:hypothetical protein